MARFDVYRAARTKGYLLDCQSDLLSTLATRVVVPLLPANSTLAATRLNPVFDIEGDRFVMQTPMIVSLPKDRLTQPVASLDEFHLEIMAAIDMLWSGV